MLCERPLGSIAEEAMRSWLAEELGTYTVEEVSFAWDEAAKRILRKRGAEGTEVGIRLTEEVRRRGIRTGDVLGIDRGRRRVVVAYVDSAPAIVARVEPGDAAALSRLAWEVGNTHTPLFAGSCPGEFAMPWSEPLFALVRALPGVAAEASVAPLDPGRRIGGAAGQGSLPVGACIATGAGGPAPCGAGTRREEAS